MFASSSRDRTINIYHVNNEYQTVKTLDDHTASITQIKWIAPSPLKVASESVEFDYRLISFSRDHSVVVRSVKINSKGILKVTRENSLNLKASVDCFVLGPSPGLSFISSGTVVYLYDYNKHKTTLLSSLNAGKEASKIFAMDLEPISKKILAVGIGSSIFLISVVNSTILAKLSGYSSHSIRNLKFSADGNFLICTFLDVILFFRIAY